MTDAIVITPKVIKVMQNFAEDERKAIFEAFACDEIFGTNRTIALTPYQELLYLIVKDYIKRDSVNFTNNIRENIAV